MHQRNANQHHSPQFAVSESLDDKSSGHGFSSCKISTNGVHEDVPSHTFLRRPRPRPSKKGQKAQTPYPTRLQVTTVPNARKSLLSNTSFRSRAGGHSSAHESQKPSQSVQELSRSCTSGLVFFFPTLSPAPRRIEVVVTVDITETITQSEGHGPNFGVPSTR